MKDKELQYLDLAAIVRDSDDAIIGKTLEGIITSWNGGAERIYGYTAEEAIGRSVAMLVPADREDELPEILQKLTRGEGIKYYDTLRVTKDGRLVNISLTISPIRDASGAITGASSIGRDITDRKQIEEALRTSELRYRTLIEQASDAIFLADHEGNFLDVNSMALEMLGYTRDELLQLNVRDILSKDDQAILAGQWDRTLYAGTNLVVERRMRRKDDTFFYAESSSKMLDDGGLQAIVRDITERKRAEETKKSLLAEVEYERKRLDTILNTVPGVVWESWGKPDDAMQRIDFVSEHVVDLLGYSVQQGLSTPNFWLKIVHPDDQAQISKLAAARYAGAKGGRLEFRWIRADGQVIWVESQSTLILDDDGKPLGLRGVTIDVTERKRANEQIQFQAHVINQVQAAIIVTDMQGTVTQWNQYAEKLYGWKSEEVLGQPILSIMAGPVSADADANVELGKEIMSQVMAEGSWEGEFMMQNKDGRIFPAYVVDSLIRDQEGSPIGIAGISVDITERKRSEEKLRNSEERFKKAFNICPLTLSITRISDGLAIEVNDSLLKLLGYTRDEVIGKSTLEIGIWTNPADRERMMALLREHGSVSDFEFQFQKKSGEVGDGLLFADILEIGEEPCLLAMCQDITERKRADEALKESNQKFHAIFENTLDSMFITDEIGRFVDINSAGFKLTGSSAEKLIGNRYDIFPNMRSATGIESFEDQLAERGEARGEIQFVDLTGDTRDIEIFTKVNFIPGYSLSVAHDATERKRGEDARLARDTAERANHAKSEFLSRMSHELRTPLNSILGFGQLLQMEVATADQQESVGYIVRAGMHLLNLINEVLDIARIDEGKLNLSIEPVFVREVLEESLDLLGPLASHRNIELKVDVAWSDNCYVMADRQRLQQVLLNLLANAIKYNHEDGIVTVTCCESNYEADEGQRSSDPQAPQLEQSAQARARVRIEVSDTGPGLSPDKVGRLFTPFERLGAEQSAVEGTGLGLALSRHLVEAMGGAIGVKSEQGIGSTFWVELAPAEEHVPGLELIDTGPLSNSHLEEQARTVLYIEDNLSNLRLIERIVRKRPEIKLMTAMQGQMGLDIAYEHRPDLILLDLHLPDMTGNEVLRLLQEDPRTAPIPVVVLTADANPQQVDKILKAGAQAYLTKPLDVSQLLVVLGETAALSGAR